LSNRKLLHYAGHYFYDTPVILSPLASCDVDSF